MKNFFRATLVAITLICSSVNARTLQASDEVLNIFTKVDNSSTLAGNYYKWITNDEYELQKCPNGKLRCPGEEIQNQDFWKSLDTTTFPYYEPLNNNPAFDEKFVYKKVRYWRQCTAFAKKVAKSSLQTSYWDRGASVKSSARDYNANLKHRGKIIAYFGRDNSTNYGNIQSGYGHVGMLAEFVYDSKGNPIGFWIVDQNFYGTPNGDGIIRKHLIKFDNSYGVYDGSNYYFVEV